MFEDTTFLGISMVPRANRRALVVVTYVLTAGVIAAFIALARAIGAHEHSSLKSLLVLLVWVPILFVLFVIPGSGSFRGIFGRLVPAQTLSFRVRSIHSLGLARGIQDEDHRADERETSVRNSASSLAFRIVAWYAAVFLSPCAAPLVSQGGEAVRIMAAVAAIPIVVMLFTLPQAIILWAEPDLPVDVRPEQ